MVTSACSLSFYRGLSAFSLTWDEFAVRVQCFSSNPNPPYALHHSQPWMGCFGLCDCARGEVIGVMGSGEGYGMAVECTRDSGFGQKPWERWYKVLAGTGLGTVV
ncbi:hypothetical protein Tco_0263000, partial [Tanacetum coccineum]